MSRRGLLTLAAVGAAAGIAFRIWALLLPQGALDADEAVVGLMSRSILHGTLPVFFPGQGYGGTQESFLAAPRRSSTSAVGASQTKPWQT